MVKMIERTANLLNDTDDFERKLNEMLEENTLRTSWLAFKTEQDERLWADRPGWKPGDFLYKRPVFAYGEQYIRPMIEMMEDLEFHNSDGVKFVARCKDCDVSWVGPEACWSCGVECAPVAGTCGCGCGLLNSPPRIRMGFDFGAFVSSTQAMAEAVERMSQSMYSAMFITDEMRMLLGMTPRVEVIVDEVADFMQEPETVVVEGIEISNVDPMTIEEPRTEMRIRFPGLAPYVDYSPGWSAPLATESRRPRRV